MILIRRSWATTGSEQRDGRIAGGSADMSLVARYLTIGKASTVSAALANRNVTNIYFQRFDPSGNVVEHYSDGDLVNRHSPFQREPAGPNLLYIWGPNLPLAYLSGKLEDVGKVAKAPPDAAKPAVFESKSLEIT